MILRKKQDGDFHIVTDVHRVQHGRWVIEHTQGTFLSQSFIKFYILCSSKATVTLYYVLHIHSHHFDQGPWVAIGLEFNGVNLWLPDLRFVILPFHSKVRLPARTLVTRQHWGIATLTAQKHVMEYCKLHRYCMSGSLGNRLFYCSEIRRITDSGSCCVFSSFAGEPP